MKKKTISLNVGIKTIEQALDINLSKEQVSVLKYDYKTPVLLNSCAGAGKTTLLIISILLRVITNRTVPENILGVTFSRKARLNMQLKYHQFLERFNDYGLTFKGIQVPKFTTFHALFFHLLQRISKRLNVLPSYTSIMLPLMKAMQIHPKLKSTSEVIQSIFELRSQLIDHGYTWNGYDLRNQSDNLQNLKKDATKLGNAHNDDFYRNYYGVVKAYDNYKKKHGLIDFNDMKIKLYQSMGNSRKRTKIDKIMQHYQLCLVDEFQDVDPIQWKLLQLILPKEAKEHFGAIGDDDQSIYSFRGSDPNIILHFQENVPHTKRFNLTTNYRTAGNILKSVKPVIENNKYRLGKELNTNRPGKGHLICYHDDKYATGSQLMFNNLMQKVHNPKINNGHIAILTRTNLDKTLAVDQLANHHKYIHVKKSNILQNNYMYQIFVDLMEALYLNKFSLFIKHAKRIGFYRYKKHIKQIMYFINKPYIQYLTDYIKVATRLDDMYKQQIIRHGDFTIKDDRNLKNAMLQTDILKQKQPKDETEQLFDIANGLTENYFNFMCNKNYINKELYSSIKNYLIDRTSQVQSPIKFFKEEWNKHQILEHARPSELDKLNVITIHQAKGLQFDYVYVYNYTSGVVDGSAVDLDNVYSPDVSKKKFLEITLKNLKILNKGGFCQDCHDFGVNLYKAIKTMTRYIKRKNSSKHLTTYQARKIAKKRVFDELLKHRFYDSKFNKTADDEYQVVVSICQQTEEERRLVYVSFTRAIKDAYYNVSEDTSCLLSELDIPRKNILEKAKNGKIINRTQLLHQEGLNEHSLNLFQNVLSNMRNKEDK